MRGKLDHRGLRVQEDYDAGVKPSGYTPAMLQYRMYLAGLDITDEASIAFAIRASRRQSEIVEALVLSGCPFGEIEEAFRVPRKSVEIYAELFFDISVFSTDLDRLEYLEDYPDAAGRELKMKAVSLGYEYVLFNFANLVPKNTAQKKLVERMFMATAYKAMSMNFNGIKSEANKLAVRHAELMIRAYDLLAKINADEGSSTYDLVALLVREDAEGAPEKPSSEEIV